MQRVTLKIGLEDALPGLRFEVYSNADRNGLAQEAIDTAEPVSGREPLPYRPLVQPGVGFLAGPFLEGPFLGPPPAAGETEWTSRPLYHGVYEFQVKSYDSVGNPTSGSLPVYRAAVRSGPRSTRNFRQTSVDGDGRPVFGFVRPPQLV